MAKMPDPKTRAHGTPGSPPESMPDNLNLPPAETPSEPVLPVSKPKPLPTPTPRSRFSRKRRSNRELLPAIEEKELSHDDLTVTDQIHRNRKPLSSVLVSMIVHTVLILTLAFVVYSKPNVEPVISIEAEVFDEPKAEHASVEIEKVEVEIPIENESPIEMEHEDTSVDMSELQAEAPTSLVDVPNENQNPTQAEATAPMAPLQTLPTGGGLEGRDAESRARLAAARGGSAASEKAVENGLKWIIKHQFEDGSWRFKHGDGPCNGRCRDEGTKESTTAATGLSLMALLGAGYTHERGPYQEQVKNGLDYLRSRMRVTRYGGNLAEGTMYAQAIATIALSEAYIMTRDPELKEPVQQAMTYIISAQGPRGGWRYNPGQPGDMTVTGWQIMALKSCQMAGFEVPSTIINNAREFLKSKGESGGSYYGYQKPGIEPVPTAVGLLSQMYLGWEREREALHTGVERIGAWGVSKTDVYFNYYATQVIHHTQNEFWDVWNPEMRDYLVKTQDTKKHQAGSWFFRDKHGKVGGRLYTTAMCVMTLEVYYRYLPLYDDHAVESR